MGKGKNKKEGLRPSFTPLVGGSNPLGSTFATFTEFALGTENVSL